jgi:hypothetical protein
MDPERDSFWERYRWHVVIVIGVVVVVVAILMQAPLGGSVAQEGGASNMQLIISTSIVAILLVVALLILARISSIVDALGENSQRLEEVTRVLSKLGDSLHDICRSTQLSETAKAIAFRDTERDSLQEAVSAKLNSRNFEAAYQLIDEIGQRPEYRDLAETLRGQAEKHRDAIRMERIHKVIGQIETLLDQYEWTKASVQIEGLIKAYPDSERARSMRQHLHHKREQHKKELLSAWDNAVQHQDTDKGLAILKELDHYLTPNEALALQEAAKDVFRTKLHNMGVKFSMAVSDKNWHEALSVGRQIITEFPNSKMSEEIKSKLDVLQQNVQLHV